MILYNGEWAWQDRPFLKVRNCVKSVNFAGQKVAFEDVNAFIRSIET